MKKNNGKESEKETKTEVNKKLNRKKIIIIGLLIVFTIIVAIFIFNQNRNVIQLERRAYEIHNWKCEIDNEKIVKLSKKKVIGNTENTNSKELILERFYFKPLKKGKTSIKCYFTNINTGSFTEYKEYEAIVDKNLKLSMKQKQ